jgi:hypothetical protein
MEKGKNRVRLVYQALGRVLSNPQDFGLGTAAPDQLIIALAAMRSSLREELAEKDDLMGDWLSGELAQDADPVARRSSRG